LEQFSALSVYPNPASGVLNLVYNNSTFAKTAILNLVGVDGKIFISKQLNVIIGINTYKIDVSKLQPATYILNVQTGDKQESIKVLIK
jgi:hypothetical protein